MINSLKLIAILMLSFCLSHTALAEDGSAKPDADQAPLLNTPQEPNPNATPEQQQLEQLKEQATQPMNPPVIQDKPPADCVKCENWCQTKYPNTQATCFVDHCGMCTNPN